MSGPASNCCTGGLELLIAVLVLEVSADNEVLGFVLQRIELHDVGVVGNDGDSGARALTVSDHYLHNLLSVPRKGQRHLSKIKLSSTRWKHAKMYKKNGPACLLYIFSMIVICISCPSIVSSLVLYTVVFRHRFRLE